MNATQQFGSNPVPSPSLPLPMTGEGCGGQHGDTMVTISQTGPVCARTTRDLALIQALPPQCFDVNVSYPRIRDLGADSSEITIRVGNAGAMELDSGTVVLFQVMNAAGTVVREQRAATNTRLWGGSYAELSVTVPRVLVGNRVRFLADPDARLMERDEKNNVIVYEVK